MPDRPPSLYTQLDFPPSAAMIDVVDVGANPIDAEPAYLGLLRGGHARVVGFEPNRDALVGLNAHKSVHETYLPLAIGDGSRRKLHFCVQPGMTSLFKPNEAVLWKFHGFPEWAQITRSQEVDTVRLDDVAEIGNVDLLKLDIQGAELMALENAERCLKSAVAVQTEVEFVQLYENQPLFADIDRFMRGHGFQLHRFEPLYGRVMTPLLAGNDVYAAGSQVMWTDAIYVKHLFEPWKLPDDKLLKTAIILHDCYSSFDVALNFLLAHDKRRGTSYGATFGRTLSAGSDGYFRIV